MLPFQLLAALLVTRPTIDTLKEYLIPYVQKQMKVAKLSYDQSSDGIHLTPIELENLAPDYKSTFDDYLEMFIQFGYVILFSPAYPLAGCCALLNNLIEIRGDAYKLCLIHKRPFGTRVNSIGSWQVPIYFF